MVLILAFYRSNTNLAGKYLRFVVCKFDSEINFAEDRLRKLKIFLMSDK